MTVPDRLPPRAATRSLQEDWLFRPDPEDRGLDAGWHDPENEWAEARSVSLPFAWQEADDLREYTGVGWYRRSIEDFPTFDEECALLRFGAVDHAATVWVDGTRVGTHEGGYLPFGMDVTDALDDGPSEVVVRVEDPDDGAEILHGKQADGWYTPVSGIWQSVDLLVVPVERVSGAYATPDLDADAVTVDAETTFDAGGTGRRVTVTVRDGDGDVLGTATEALGPDGDASATVALEDPTYWTPETPTLYEFDVELVDAGEPLDTYTDRFGLREVSVTDDRVLLNGDPIRLRGALDQAYYPDTLYRPADLDTFADEIEAAKAAGFNLLRKHIKPPHPAFVRAADELGMLVWAEPANPTVYTDDSKRRVREQFAGMVERDFNAPSVVAWSLYNEEWGIGLDQTDFSDHAGRLDNDGEKQDYLAEFVAEARERDPTRLICDNSGWAHVDTDLNDYHEYFVLPDRADPWRERLDAIGADPADNYATTRYDDPDQTPRLVSEFGTWGLPDVSALREHSDGDPHWFEHEWLTGLKRPAGVDERFAASPLAEAFDDLSELATAWQRRELDSVVAAIRDLRADHEMAGYVLTELTDVEWEFNGVLDSLREPKAGVPERLAAVNAPVTAWVEPRTRVWWDDEQVVGDLVVVNDGTEDVTVIAEWAALAESGTVTVDVPANGVGRVTDAVSFVTPAVSTTTTESITVTLSEGDRETETMVAVAPAERSGPSLTLAVDDDALAAALADRGYTVVDPVAGSVPDADLIVATGSTDGIEGGDGTTVLLLPDREGHVRSVEGTEPTRLPETESWNLCAGNLTQSLLEGVDRIPGWAFDGIYPYGYLEATRESDRVPVGYAEGWVANAGAAVRTRTSGSGPRTVCTLRVTDGYGDHPVATAVLDTLLARIGGETGE